MGRNRASCRRSIATAGATAAVQDTTGAEAEEEEEKELRLLTWMEVEARIERDIAKVRFVSCSCILFRRLPLTADVVRLRHYWNLES